MYQICNKKGNLNKIRVLIFWKVELTYDISSKFLGTKVAKLPKYTLMLALNILGNLQLNR
jgi:hypothetical protein